MKKEKNLKKSQNKGNIQDNVKKILLILLLIAVIMLISVYMIKLNTEETQSGEFYQYFGGKKIEYQGALKITKKGEITQLECTDINIQLDSTPVYYQNERDKVLLPENMAKVVPIDNGRMTKVNRFSNIYRDEETIYLQSQSKNAPIENAFLYDGADLYIFVQKTTVTVEEEEYSLSPFSYIISTYHDSVEIYNYAKDEYTIIPTTNNVIAKTDDYEINTTVDSIKYGEKEQLLLKKMDDLSNE